MPEFLKVCVVGCGARGSQYAEAWNNRDDAEVVALSDVDPEPLKTVADNYDVAACTDWREAVLREGVQGYGCLGHLRNRAGAGKPRLGREKPL